MGCATNDPGEHSTATRGFGFREVRDSGARLDLFPARGRKQPDNNVSPLVTTFTAALSFDDVSPLVINF